MKRLLTSMSIAFGMSGCLFQNIAPTAHFTDAVNDLNDDLRWGRIGLAVSRVAPAYQSDFVEARQGWANRLQVAEVEIMQARLDENDSEKGTSLVMYSWYGLNDMTVHSSTIKQTWTYDGRYQLSAEEIIDGDQTLLSESDFSDDEVSTGIAKADSK